MHWSLKFPTAWKLMKTRLHPSGIGVEVCGGCVTVVARPFHLWANVVVPSRSALCRRLTMLSIRGGDAILVRADPVSVAKFASQSAPLRCSA